MLGEFLLRLAVALPLVCALAAASLWAVRRGWLRLPRLSQGPAGPGTPQPLELLAVRAVTPTARLAVVRFAGRDHLLGVTGQTVSLIAAAEPGATAASTPTTAQGAAASTRPTAWQEQIR